MTDTDVDVETLARRIADRGQDSLVRRLRTAYADAAAAHADLISLDREQIEAMVQSAVENADGLQWRRALAEVAAEELGVSVTEALTNPAVTRAQALVGAPSYEQSIAEMITRPVPPPAQQPAPVPPPAQQPAPVPTAVSANGSTTVAAETDVIPEPEPPAPEPEPEPEPEPPMPGPSVSAHQSVSAADSELPPTDEHRSLSADEGEHQSSAADGDEHPSRAVAEAAGQGPDELAPPALEEPTPASADELETVEADDVVLELLPEPEPIEYETETYDVQAAFSEGEERAYETEPFSPAAGGESDPYPATAAMTAGSAVELEDAPGGPELTIPAIHQGGVANLPTKREGLSVRLSAEGLDILQGEHDIIGRLIWEEIETLDVPHHRSRRRRHEQRARLMVRTPHGDASFDVPGIAADDLRDRVEPIVRLYGRH